MQLTADLYRDILASLRSDTKSNRNLEKRGAPRVGLRSRLTIIPANGSAAQPVSAWVRDLSANGIGIVHTESLPVGSQFTAMFAGRLNDTLTVVFTVVNCKELSKNLFSIGATIANVKRK